LIPQHWFDKTKQHWDIFLGPPERARAETGGADQWVLKRRKLTGFAIVNEKKRPHPWDTHHQFSIKTLLSKEKGQKRKRGKKRKKRGKREEKWGGGQWGKKKERGRGMGSGG